MCTQHEQRYLLLYFYLLLVVYPNLLGKKGYVVVVLVVYPEEILNTNCFGEFSSSCIVKANDVH